MGDISKTTKFDGFYRHRHADIPPFSKKVNQTLEKIKAFIKRQFERKEHEIYHLGGTKVGSFDFENSGKGMNKEYFYERIPIKSPNGEIFLYGKTLKPYVKKWMNETKNGRFTGTFQEYMEKHVDFDALSGDKVRYLSQEERNQTEISIQGGSLCQLGLDSTNTQRKALPEGKYAYVIMQTMDANGNPEVKLYASPKENTSKGKLQHSSFARGGNVISAGMIEISSAGKLSGIANFSGHYRPSTKELLACLSFLKEKS